VSIDLEMRPATRKTLLAFGIVYFVWGSTFLAVRVGVQEVPPCLLAGMRFLTAGFLMFCWLLYRRTTLPTLRQWGSVVLLATLIFVIDYGLLFWAEKRVPSGIAAVMMSTIPVFMGLFEILLLKTQRLTFRLAVALLIGIGGVSVLISHSMGFGENPIDRTGAAALLIGSISWSIASILTRKLPLPDSKPMSSAAQMLAGGLLLLLVGSSLGEWHGFHVEQVSSRAWLSLAYLVVAGSIVGFTAYIWLIHHESPTKVGTYAYVNPVFAVIVGYFLGGESVGPRTFLGMLLVLVSVIVIVTVPARKREMTVWKREVEVAAD
jgi:drug/metabolite transporter (DMT)-like permease